jgi:hypothetical protein
MPVQATLGGVLRIQLPVRIDVAAVDPNRGRATNRALLARREVEVAALPAAIERLLGRNLGLVTASALLAAPPRRPGPDAAA